MREHQALVAPKPPQGVLVRGQAGFEINKLSFTDRLRSSAGTWRGFGGDYSTCRRPQLEEEALLEGLDIWYDLTRKQGFSFSKTRSRSL